MSYYTAPDGMIIIYPEFSDRALLNVFPSTFVRKLIAANPYLPCRLLTCDNVMYVFQGLVTYRSLKESLFSDVRAQQAGLIDRVSHDHPKTMTFCYLLLHQQLFAIIYSQLLTQSLTVEGLGRLEIPSPAARRRRFLCADTLPPQPI